MLQSNVYHDMSIIQSRIAHVSSSFSLDDNLCMKSCQMCTRYSIIKVLVLGKIWNFFVLVIKEFSWNFIQTWRIFEKILLFVNFALIS